MFQEIGSNQRAVHWCAASGATTSWRVTLDHPGTGSSADKPCDARETLRKMRDSADADMMQASGDSGHRSKASRAGFTCASGSCSWSAGLQRVAAETGMS